MSLRQHRNRLLTVRIAKVLSLLILMVLARHAFAQGSCATDENNGFVVGDKCYTIQDEFDNYIESRCEPFPGDDPTSTNHLDCKQSYDQGHLVCTGSTCVGQASTQSCTYHGVCQDDFDCCGMNWCDSWGDGRCHDWDSPPEN